MALLDAVENLAIPANTLFVRHLLVGSGVHMSLEGGRAIPRMHRLAVAHGGRLRRVTRDWDADLRVEVVGDTKHQLVR